MPGGSSKTTTQVQDTKTAPWEAAVPLLNSVIGKYSGLSTDVTGDQSDALARLRGDLSGMTNFGGAGSDLVSRLFGADSSGEMDLMRQGYNTLQNNLQPIAGGSLDPYQTPGFSDALSRMTGDITKNVKNVYAASGRDPSGAGSFAGSLGRGLAEGIAPTIASQFNANRSAATDAAKTLYGGAGATASGLAGLRQGDLSTGIQGLTAGAALPGLYSAPGLADLNLANTSFGQPYSNIAQLLQPAVALGGLGSSSHGTTTGTQQQQDSLMSNILGGATAGVGLLGKMGAFPSAAGAGWLSSALPFLALSDERLKEDIEPVGKLFDGTDLYSYRFKGSPRTEIGVMAQEEAERDPSNVYDLGGVLAVDYGGVARRAHHARESVGRLLEAA